MRPEAVVLGVVSPMDVDGARPLGSRTDAVAPVIIIGKAAARPSQHGYADGFQVVHSLLAVAIDIRDARIPADPQASVNAGAEVLGEMTVQLRADGPNGGRRLNFNPLLQGCKGTRLAGYQ